MRKVYLPYVFLTWCMMSIAAINWLLQLVLFIHHDDYSSNPNLMIIQSLFVLYLAWQHVQFFLRTDEDNNNPHIQAALLLVISTLFILNAWWLLAFMLMCMHSFLIAELLMHFMQRLYQLSAKTKYFIQLYSAKKLKG